MPTPSLVVGDIERLPSDGGTRVRLRLSPNKKASYTAYQNIAVFLNGRTWLYSEAWSLNTTKGVHDVFSLPEELRQQAWYVSAADIWLEPGGVDPSYKRGVAHDAETPWGTAKGRHELRRPPQGAEVTRRVTRLEWDQSELLAEADEWRGTYVASFAATATRDELTPPLPPELPLMEQGGGALDLHRGFTGLGGIYVIGERNPRDVPGREVFWKVGMSVDLRSRLGSH